MFKCFRKKSNEEDNPYSDQKMEELFNNLIMFVKKVKELNEKMIKTVIEYREGNKLMFKQKQTTEKNDYMQMAVSQPSARSECEITHLQNKESIAMLQHEIKMLRQIVTGLLYHLNLEIIPERDTRHLPDVQFRKCKQVKQEK